MRPRLGVLPVALGAATVLTLTGCAGTTHGPSSSTSSIASPSAAVPAQQPSGASVFTPVIGDVLAAPVEVRATDGKVHLAYELKLTNTLSQDVTLTSLAVQSGPGTLLNLSAGDLAHWTRVLGSPAPTTTLGPGTAALVWLDVGVDNPSDVPAGLEHAIGISVSKPAPPLVPPTLTETIAPTSVQTRKPVLISPPLAGPNWLDGDGCCDMMGHRMAVNPIGGALWVAERFAVDYIQLTGGRMFNGDKTKLESYPYFGAGIHAVADGPVVAVVDGLPEQIPGANPTGLPLDQYGGNHIVQDIGGGNYAFYAHLKTGSITVKPGEQLAAGQKIAALGNSGNSDAPHLHFHVMSTLDPLRSNGLPFVLTSFRLDARIASIDDLGPLTDTGAARFLAGFAARDETQVSPLVLDVMSYPGP
jgi:Peptidase family M23